MINIRARVTFLLMLTISGLILLQMILYLAHLLFGSEFTFNLFEYCLNVLTENTKGHFSVDFVIAGLIGYTLIWMLRRIIKQAVLSYKLKKRLVFVKGKEKKILLLQTKEPLAFTMGLFKPQIVLSTGLLKQFSEPEIKAIVLHEEYHQKHFDPLKVFTATLLSEGMAYVPVMRDLLDRYKTYKELLADQYAIKQMNSSSKLGSALLKLIKQKSSHSLLLTAPFAGGAADKRIRQILNPHESIRIAPMRPGSTWLSVGMMVTLLMMVSGGCT